jgi:acetylornithine aminotransferase
VEAKYVLTPEAVGDAVLAKTAIVFLNYPHNPSGQDMPPDVYRRWVDARARHGFLLVSDEVYIDLYLGAPPHSLLEYGREGCLAVHSLSKRSGMTGYLTGFLAGDEAVIASLKRHRAGMGVASPPWIQAAAAAAWQDDAHVAERRATLGEKRQVIVEALEARGSTVYPTTSALFVWAEIPKGDDDDVACAARLASHGIVVAPGSLFGPGQSRFIRLALAPSLEACREAASIWP